jgi:hypothetical protein
VTLTVLTAATQTDLTTLAAVKAELGLTDNKDNVWLALQIAVASQIVTDYLNVVEADDGTVTLGREQLAETFRIHRSRYLARRLDSERTQYLVLSRRPIASIDSVVHDGVTLDPSEYEVDGAGILKHLASDRPTDWNGNKVVVTYTAGWLLPGQTGRNLLADIESATIGLVKASWYARLRDPNIKSEEDNIPGVRDHKVDYFFRSPEPGAPLPEEIAQKLNRHRQINI